MTSKKYLIYVNRYDFPVNGQITDVYVYEGDVFHAMGEIMFRSFLQIYSLTYSLYTDEKAAYWSSRGCKIRTWHDKYPF